jgi:hypothetical protein
VAADSEDYDYVKVQHEACPVCGRNTSVVPSSDLAPALIDASRQWREFFGAVLDYPGGRDSLRERPAPEVWSAIEYGCHVRDVLSVFARRVELTLLAEEPEYGWWDHEAAVVEDHYVEQDAVAVGDDINSAATELARLSQPLDDAHRLLTGTRMGRSFTIDGLLRFALHEALHHLDDARAVVPQPSGE